MSPSASTQDNTSKKRVAIIGAGCVGLTAIKQCLDERDRLEAVCFEQEAHSGGLWRYVEVTKENPNPHSSVYKSTIINTSKEMMTFSDYAIPGSWPTYLHNRKVVQYFDMYAEHFRLRDHIRFCTKVVEIRELKDEQHRWMVRSHLVASASGSADAGSPVIQEEIFDYVMMCTGHHSRPRYPSLPGMNPDEPDAFTGQQIHSHYYRDPAQFKEKNVVVVGLGNSAVDVAVEMSGNQSQVYLSCRSPVWVVPRWLLGKPTDQHLSRFTFWLPLILIQLFTAFVVSMSMPRMHPLMKPKCRVFNSHATVNSALYERITTGTIVPRGDIKRIGPGKRVEFEDGSVAEDIDVIFWCTGYHFNFPALDPTIISNGKEDLENNRVWLWNYMLPPRHPNLAFIGLFQAVGALMPPAEMQCRFLAQTWAGRSPSPNPIPNPTQMDIEIQELHKKIQGQYGDSPRHTTQVDFAPYMDQLSKRIGCYPSFRKLVQNFGLGEGMRLWWETNFGPPIPIHHRLVGRHTWVGDKSVDGGDEDKERPGEAARQVIWGYKVADNKYKESKYLREDCTLLEKTRDALKKGVLIDV